MLTASLVNIRPQPDGNVQANEKSYILRCKINNNYSNSSNLVSAIHKLLRIANETDRPAHPQQQQRRGYIHSEQQ